MPPGARPQPLGGSSIDQMLAGLAASGGVSAPPSPAEAANPNGIKPATLPGDVKPVTSTNGWGGVLDAFKAVGGQTPAEYQSEADKILAQVNAANAPAIKGITANIAKRDQILSQPVPHPVIPQLGGMPRAPDQSPRDPKQVFQQNSTILAMLGSLFTRKPLVTAMNAAAAAMKGYAEGDKDAAERAHKTWKDSLEAAVAQNQAEMDQYNLLMQDTSLTLEDRNAQLAGLAASNNDQNMLAALKSGAPDMQYNLLQGRQKSAESLTGMLIQSQQFEQQQALEREKMAETERYHAQLTGTATGSGPLDPETVQMLAQQYISGDPSALSGLGSGRMGLMARKQVLDFAAKSQQGGATPDIALSRAGYAADKATLKQMQNYISRADTFQSVFLKNINQVKKYSQAGVAGEVPVINKWIQAGRRATGDPDVAAFDAAIRTAGREYARIMSGPTSNAQLTVSAQATADEMLSPNMNADQLQAVINVMEQDIQNSIGAAADTVDAIKSSISAKPDGDTETGAPQEGDVFEQNGHHFKYSGGQYVPVD